MIAGLGNAGMDHARALESIPDATVIAGIDIDSTRSLMFRDGPVPVYLDASAAYNARLDPDVIVIAAPTGVHDQVCADAAKYFPQAVLLVEKPAADRLRSAMADWYRARAGELVTTDGLAGHLHAWSGIDIGPWWARYVHGRD